MARPSRTPRVYSSTVLFEADGRGRLWSFGGTDARPGGVVETRGADPLPSRLVGKGWRQLVQPRMNVAWIGDQPVFLQLIALPTDDPAEVPAMLELQIEKISPLPAAQIVWTYHILDQRSPAGLPVLVMIAERSRVEEMLGTLEKRGFVADRIESPLLALVAGAKFETDGGYVFALRVGGMLVTLLGWVHQGALRALNVVNLPGDDRAVLQLTSAIDQVVWAGELEGWAASDQPIQLMGDAELVDAWKAPLELALERPVTVRTRPADADLAQASAARAAKGQGANLLPPEHAARYRQQFTDRLWMGGLLAVFLTYLAGVLVYLGVVEVQKFRQDRIATELAEVNTVFTNTLRLKAQTQVLQETVNLKYAALDSWMATVEAMPEELTLESMTFSGGQSLVISGYAPADQESKITEYWQALRRKVVGNTNLFAEVQLRPTVVRPVAGVPQIQWSFTCKLQRSEL